MVINLFFRNSINAAFGVANQIGHAAQTFTNTLRQSVTPQIMKNQEGNSERSLNLVYAISRYTFLIMLIIAVPLILCMNTVLHLWLGANNIPPMTDVFTSFLLIDGLVASLRSGFDASIQATGRVNKNQIGYTIINISIIPIVYVLYRIGMPAYINVIVGVALSLITNLFQAYIMQELTKFTYRNYWRKTVLPSISTAFFAFVPMIVLRHILGTDLLSMIILGFVSFIWVCFSVYLLGINRREKNSILVFAKRKLQ